jgi:hypothetical protein
MDERGGCPVELLSTTEQLPLSGHCLGFYNPANALLSVR